MICGGEHFSIEKRSPPHPLSKRRGGRNGGVSGGRGGFSERSPSPPRPLSPEERLAFGLVASAEVVPPERWEWFPASWLSPRRLTEPPRTCGVGGLDREKADGVCHRLSLYRRMRWAVKVYAEREKGYLCGGSLLASLHAKPPLKGEVPAICGRRGSSPHAAKVAAALSAAVTTTKLIEDRLHFQADPPPQKQTSQTPAALREGARGGERQT